MTVARNLTLAALLLCSSCARHESGAPQGEPLASASVPVTAIPATAVPAKATAFAAGPTQPAASISAQSSAALADCKTVCAAATQLKCAKSASCIASCLAMAASATCTAQLGQFFKCLSSQPVNHWECLEDGTGAIREGFCESEQSAFAECLSKEQH